MRQSTFIGFFYFNKATANFAVSISNITNKDFILKTDSEKEIDSEY